MNARLVLRDLPSMLLKVLVQSPVLNSMIAVHHVTLLLVLNVLMDGC